MRRLHHNTCIPRPAVRGLGELGGGEKSQHGPCYTFFMAILLSYNSDVLCGESGEEGEKAVLVLTTEESNK